MRYCIVFLIFTAFSVFGQETFNDFDAIIKPLKGQDKFNKYIDFVGKQVTRSPQIAIKLAQQAINEKELNQFPLLQAKLVAQLGDAYFLTGEYTKALPLLLQAVTQFEKLNDVKDLPLVYISIGRLYKKAQNDCENTKKYYHKAEEIYKTTKNLQELATVHNYLGNVSESCDNDLQKALSYYFMTENYYSSVNDTIGLSYSLDFISQVYAQQNKYAESIEKQTQSLQLRLAIKDSFAIAISYTNLGEIYSMQQNLQLAKENFEKAYKIAGKKDYKDLSVYLLGNLSTISKEQHDFKAAFEYLNQQIAIKDKLLDEEKHKQLAEMTTKFETEKKEIALEQEIIKGKNKTLLVLLLVGTVVILCVIIVLVIQRRKLEQQKAAFEILQNLENERTRIARDLHDNLGAELTLISSKLDMKAYKTANLADKTDLEAIRAISSNANSMLRETIWSIHKQELTVEELHQKAKDYVKRIFSDKEVQTTIVASDKESKLSPSVALHLYRIIQESVNNASKYAECKELKVAIDATSVTITDNGIGFDEDIVKNGYGLQNIRQRVEEINGQLNFQSKLGGGTKIEVIYHV
ncbi:MAG: sensor histidine kinase [Crocinitomicaceae bacterium]|nr:sensor histidine kinase [Crocinitomicaceae bacterium]